jgi:hypothetical protein
MPRCWDLRKFVDSHQGQKGLDLIISRVIGSRSIWNDHIQAEPRHLTNNFALTEYDAFINSVAFATANSRRTRNDAWQSCVGRTRRTEARGPVWSQSLPDVLV